MPEAVSVSGWSLRGRKDSYYESTTAGETAPSYGHRYFRECCAANIACTNSATYVELRHWSGDVAG